MLFGGQVRASRAIEMLQFADRQTGLQPMLPTLEPNPHVHRNNCYSYFSYQSKLNRWIESATMKSAKSATRKLRLIRKAGTQDDLESETKKARVCLKIPSFSIFERAVVAAGV